MMFYSTKRKSPKVDFETAVMQGLAPDGGLYFPDEFPQFTKEDLTNLTHAHLKDVGVAVMKKWVEKSIDPKTLNQLMKNALQFPIKLKSIGPYYVLELFHGPTLAFKDIASTVLAELMNYFLNKNGKKVTLLVATSGDTGGAVAQGFANMKHIRVVVLYPSGKVSALQEEQLTRVAPNVTTIAVEGFFDDCQQMVKKAFLDQDLTYLNLTSANSISIGRLLPQIIYYVYAFALLSSKDIQFIVPSGNMGNITAGLFAAEMGLPFTSFITAFNANDPVVKYYETGHYEPQQAVKTISNAMDIGNPSNFVRILELFEHSHEQFRTYIKADSISDQETVETIKEVYNNYGYLLDPHSAVAWNTTARLAERNKIQVILATASPVKFAEDIRKKTGIEISDREEIDKLMRQEKRVTKIKSDYDAFKKLLQGST